MSSGRPWTEQEVNLLLNSKKSNYELATILGRSVMSVAAKKKRCNKEKWREENRKYYKKTENAENSRKRWTKQEIDLVLKHEKTDAELSKLLGRSVKSIQLIRFKNR